MSVTGARDGGERAIKGQKAIIDILRTCVEGAGCKITIQQANYGGYDKAGNENFLIVSSVAISLNEFDYVVVETLKIKNGKIKQINRSDDYYNGLRPDGHTQW